MAPRPDSSTAKHLEILQQAGPGAIRQRWPRRKTSESAAGPDQPHDQQQQYGADRRIDDLRNQAAADGNAELGKQVARDQRAGDADENVANNAKAGAAHDLAGQPAGDQADEQDDENAFVG